MSVGTLGAVERGLGWGVEGNIGSSVPFLQEASLRPSRTLLCDETHLFSFPLRYLFVYGCGWSSLLNAGVP